MIEVSWIVYDELESIRKSGIVNMVDYKSVLGHSIKKETQKWLKENKDLYQRGVMFGFSPIMDTK